MSLNIKHLTFNKIKIFAVLLLFVNCYLLIVNSCYAWTDPSGDTPATIQDIEDVFSRILSLAIPAAGIAAFIMLLVGGFKYLTSGGDPKQSQAAQQTITYAVIGLILLVSAYIIINFISTFTGVEVGTFIIPK